MGVSKPLIRMMVNGVYLDKRWVTKYGDEMTKDSYELFLEINRMVGHDDELINLESPKQLSDLLYNELGMTTSVLTNTGSMSTSSAALREIQSRVNKEYPDVREFLQMILDYRKLRKLSRTYLVPLREQHMDREGYVHTRYYMGKSYAKGMSGGTVTGRLSSATPNLQNIPRDYRVKGAFIPAPGHKFFEVDYRQLEVRVAAWYSEEPLLLDAIEQELDIHTHTLSLISGEPYIDLMDKLEAGDKKTKEARALTKRVLFGTLYGAGPYTIQQLMRDMNIEVSLTKAKTTIRDFFNAYPKLKLWIDHTELGILEDGYTTTPTGRVRHLPNVDSQTASGRAKLRQGVNFRVQSLASDVTLMGIQRLDQALAWEGSERLVLTVHDSIVGEYDHIDDEVLEGIIEHELVDGVNKGLHETFGVEPRMHVAVDIQTNLKRWGTEE
jgi:DNA polymerase-1